MTHHAINWFEIPTVDIDRAVTFYSTIFDAKMEKMEMYPGFTMAMLPYQDGIGGAIVHGEGYTPSNKEGTVIYLNGGDDLNAVLNRVEAAGGKKLSDKQDIGENGFVAFFQDTEGNRIGLHSMG